MDEKRELPMDLRIFIDDETEFYNGIPDGVDKIFSAHLFDANLDVHICSFQANKECYYIGHTFTTTRDLTEKELEAVDEYLLEANRDEPRVDYFDGKIKGHSYHVVERPEAEDPDEAQKLYEEIMEEHVESLSCNTGTWECLVGKPVE
jgi:hypothetical protein